MKKENYYILIGLALFISLYIYLVYRTDKTIINILFNQLILTDHIKSIKQEFRNGWPLPDYIIYSLPQGLWVFSATLLSKNIHFKTRKIHFEYVYLPVIFSIILEFLQLFHVTNGWFDINDLLVSFIFWILAWRVVKCPHHPVNAIKNLNMRTYFLLASYGIVYLSDVQPL